jgi:hypothetical protein
MDAVDGELLDELFGLKYSKIKVKFTEQRTQAARAEKRRAAGT